MHRVSDNSRFVVALVVAMVAHAVLLSAIDFPRFAPPETAPSVTITLAGYRQPPTPTASLDPVLESDVPAALATPSETPPPPIAVDPPSPATVPARRPFAGRTVADLARDIAAFDRAPTTRPDSTQRVRRLLAGTTTAPEFAYYLDAWRRKVERIGNLNYPREARSRGLNGSLRLLVTIAADGALHDVRVLETSGHRTLDEAALHIVRLAAPYAPFSPKMRATTDLLEIERTWHFRNSRYSS